MSPELKPEYIKCHCGANCDVFDPETCSGQVEAIDEVEVLDGIWEEIHRCKHHVDDYWGC